jgi:hypothetical protein
MYLCTNTLYPYHYTNKDYNNMITHDDSYSYDDVLTAKGKRAKALSYTPTQKKAKHKKNKPYVRTRLQEEALEEEAENLIPFWEEAEEEEEIKPLMENIAGRVLISVYSHGPNRQTFCFRGEGDEENWYLSYDPYEGWDICFIPF